MVGGLIYRIVANYSGVSKSLEIVVQGGGGVMKIGGRGVPFLPGFKNWKALLSYLSDTRVFLNGEVSVRLGGENLLSVTLQNWDTFVDVVRDALIEIEEKIIGGDMDGAERVERRKSAWGCTGA